MSLKEKNRDTLMSLTLGSISKSRLLIETREFTIGPSKELGVEVANGRWRNVSTAVNTQHDSRVDRLAYVQML